MNTLTCKKCGEPASHLWRCDNHYTCDSCGVTPPNKPFWADGGLWCSACWDMRVDGIIKHNQRHPKETKYQALAICPWCGYAENDSWELSDGAHQCGRCEKEYDVEIEVIREYTTTKITPSNHPLNTDGGGAHAENKPDNQTPAAG